MSQDDWDLGGNTLQLIGGANTADAEELRNAIIRLTSLIGTGYYDDGDEILIPVVVYLTKKLKENYNG